MPPADHGDGRTKENRSKRNCGAGFCALAVWFLLWKPCMDSLPALQRALAGGRRGVSALFPNSFVGGLSVRGFLMSAAVLLSLLFLAKAEKTTLVFAGLVMY